MKTIAELTKIMQDLVDAKGWSGADSKREQTPRNLACSLNNKKILVILVTY